MQPQLVVSILGMIHMESGKVRKDESPYKLGELSGR